MSMPTSPAAVDLVRGEDLDTMDDWVSEVLYQLERAPWLEQSEAYEDLMRVSQIGWRVARQLIPADPEDGSIATTVVKECQAILHKIFDRNPDRMERRAQRLEAAGKRVEAADLRAKIAVVRQRIERREARTGNGGGRG